MVKPKTYFTQKKVESYPGDTSKWVKPALGVVPETFKLT